MMNPVEMARFLLKDRPDLAYLESKLAAKLFGQQLPQNLQAQNPSNDHSMKMSVEQNKEKSPQAKDCIHLGLRVNVKTGSCRGSYECDNGHGVVRPCVECKTCEDYQADDVV